MSLEYKVILLNFFNTMARWVCNLRKIRVVIYTLLDDVYL